MYVFSSIMLWKLKIHSFHHHTQQSVLDIPETDKLKANFQSEFTQKTFIHLLPTGAIGNQRGKDSCHHLTFHLEICLTDCKWCVKLNVSLLWSALNPHENELLFIYGSDPLIQGMIYLIWISMYKLEEWYSDKKLTLRYIFRLHLTKH